MKSICLFTVTLFSFIAWADLPEIEVINRYSDLAKFLKNVHCPPYDRATFEKAGDTLILPLQNTSLQAYLALGGVITSIETKVTSREIDPPTSTSPSMNSIWHDKLDATLRVTMPDASYLNFSFYNCERTLQFYPMYGILEPMPWSPKVEPVEEAPAKSCWQRLLALVGT